MSVSNYVYDQVFFDEIQTEVSAGEYTRFKKVIDTFVNCIVEPAFIDNNADLCKKFVAIIHDFYEQSDSQNEQLDKTIWKVLQIFMKKEVFPAETIVNDVACFVPNVVEPQIYLPRFLLRFGCPKLFDAIHVGEIANTDRDDSGEVTEEYQLRFQKEMNLCLLSNYLYTGDIYTDEKTENMGELLRLSEEFEMRELQEECVERLEQIVHERKLHSESSFKYYFNAVNNALSASERGNWSYTSQKRSSRLIRKIVKKHLHGKTSYYKRWDVKEPLDLRLKDWSILTAMDTKSVELSLFRNLVISSQEEMNLLQLMSIRNSPHIHHFKGLLLKVVVPLAPMAGYISHLKIGIDHSILPKREDGSVDNEASEEMVKTLGLRVRKVRLVTDKGE